MFLFWVVKLTTSIWQFEKSLFTVVDWHEKSSMIGLTSKYALTERKAFYNDAIIYSVLTVKRLNFKLTWRRFIMVVINCWIYMALVA